MRIYIQHFDLIDKNYYATFLTQVGKGSGILTNFDKFKLSINQPLDIEIDIDLPFEQLKFSQSDDLYRISTNHQTLELTGKIEDVENDMIYFRLNQDCLIMIASNQDFLQLNQHFIKINVPTDKIKLTIFGG